MDLLRVEKPSPGQGEKAVTKPKSTKYAALIRKADNGFREIEEEKDAPTDHCSLICL